MVEKLRGWFRKYRFRIVISITVLCIIMLSTLVCFLHYCHEQAQTEEILPLEIHFLDVGQGDAAVLQCGDEIMMIDGGNGDDSAFIYTYLKEKGITHLKYIFATHMHEDHIGGLSAALNQADVEEIYCSVDEYDSQAFEKFRKYAQLNGGIRIPQTSDQFTLGSAVVRVVWCDSSAVNENDRTMILQVINGKTSALFMADGEFESEQQLLARNPRIRADLIKIGHHGSDTSTSETLVNTVHPKTAVISVGKDNDYGHPSQEVLQRLSKHRVTVYRTDEMGTIDCVLDGQTTACTADASIRGKVQKTENAQPMEIPEGTTFVINLRTGKIHRTDCQAVQDIAQSNIGFSQLSQEELIREGYQLCGICGQDE